MIPIIALIMTAMLLFATLSGAFMVAPPTTHRRVSHCSETIIPTPPQHNIPTAAANRRSSSTTALHLLLDVPDSFFTVTFFGAGILLSLSKSFGRLRMEERAWEQRLEEGRQRRLARDPTLTELDLRRREAAMEWSAYGKPRMEEEAAQRQAEQATRRGRRVQTLQQQDDGNDDEDEDREYRMTEQEIDQFEVEFGVDYDPYYDDPYTLEELPQGKFSVDKRYGDRVYENGEIFYKDASSGLYYRQGAKPRSSISFF